MATLKHGKGFTIMKTLFGTFIMTIGCSLAIFIFATIQVGIWLGIWLAALPFTGWLLAAAIYKIEGE